MKKIVLIIVQGLLAIVLIGIAFLFVAATILAIATGDGQGGAWEILFG